MNASSHPSNQARSVGALRTKQDLTPEQRKLMLSFQRLRYGRIPVLRVEDGLPVLGGGLSCVRTVKVLGENAPHPAAQSEHFELRREVTDFFRMLAELGNGEVRDLEIRNGLPFSFELVETLKV